MNSVERIRATFELQPVDHLVRQEFYLWPHTLGEPTAAGLGPEK